MHIAICGPPGSGKTTLQHILHQEFGVFPVDDGRILRDIAKRTFGLTEKDVVNNKDHKVEILGKTWEIREVLGKIGNALEEEFGEFVIPHFTIQQICSKYDSVKHFSFGSVRRNQPLYFKEIGGLIVEVSRELVKSVHYFDQYDQTVTDLVIQNNGSIEKLRQNVVELFTPILRKYEENQTRFQTCPDCG